MKKILNFLKNILISPFLIYIYNLIANPLGLIIPINIVTIIVVGLLGIPGLITLVLFYFIGF